MVAGRQQVERSVEDEDVIAVSDASREAHKRSKPATATVQSSRSEQSPMGLSSQPAPITAAVSTSSTAHASSSNGGVEESQMISH